MPVDEPNELDDTAMNRIWDEARIDAISGRPNDRYERGTRERDFYDHAYRMAGVADG